MMRNIRFRGKAADGSGWVYGGLIALPDKALIAVTTGSDNPLGEWCYKGVRVHPETVGEWTGMQDANGQDVFEGDILHEAYKEDDEIDEIMGLVVFLNGAFALKEKGCEDEFLPLYDYLSGKTVVGNIHDNPDW